MTTTELRFYNQVPCELHELNENLSTLIDLLKSQLENKDNN